MISESGAADTAPDSSIQRGAFNDRDDSIRRRPPAAAPLHRETAIQKVRMAEDAWNTRDPERVSLAYTEDSRWRNRAEFPVAAPRSWRS